MMNIAGNLAKSQEILQPLVTAFFVYKRSLARLASSLRSPFSNVMWAYNS